MCLFALDNDKAPLCHGPKYAWWHQAAYCISCTLMKHLRAEYSIQGSEAARNLLLSVDVATCIISAGSTFHRGLASSACWTLQFADATSFSLQTITLKKVCAFRIMLFAVTGAEWSFWFCTFSKNASQHLFLWKRLIASDLDVFYVSEVVRPRHAHMFLKYLFWIQELKMRVHEFLVSTPWSCG